MGLQISSVCLWATPNSKSQARGKTVGTFFTTKLFTFPIHLSGKCANSCFHIYYFLLIKWKWKYEVLLFRWYYYWMLVSTVIKMSRESDVQSVAESHCWLWWCTYMFNETNRPINHLSEERFTLWYYLICVPMENVYLWINFRNHGAKTKASPMESYS